MVGGAAVTEEFHPGFRNSVASYTVGLLQPKVIRDLKLHEHGLRIVHRRVQNFLPLPDGRHLLVGEGRTGPEIAKFSARDAARYGAYQAEIERVASVLRGLVLKAPPNLELTSLAGAARELLLPFATPPAKVVSLSVRDVVGAIDNPEEHPELWTEEGWAHRVAAALSAPMHWTRDGDGWRSTRFGATAPVAPEEPVVHVCFHEARAFAAWAGWGGWRGRSCGRSCATAGPS